MLISGFCFFSSVLVVFVVVFLFSGEVSLYSGAGNVNLGVF